MPSRKQTRKNRSCRNRRPRRGGAGYSYMPAPVDYAGGNGMAQLNLGQGRQFAAMTSKYHGGGSPVGLLGGPYPNALGATLPQELVGASRINTQSFREIIGMKDPGQAGGKRRRNSRKNRKASRKNRKASRKASRKNRKNSRRSRNRRGGGHLGFASVGAPGMLLRDYSKTGMSPEWNLAKDPNAFAPLASRS